ncbi:MAG TPA: hypothetical protein VKY26_11940, partial [Actinomycetota bacterium]|nr:hypothetical protein [Actinomycetota bacterium]
MGNGIKVVGAADPPETRSETRTRTRPAPARTVPEATEGTVAPRRRRWGVAVLALVAALGIAGTVTFWQKWSGLNGTEQAAAQARRSATTFLVALTNFDA